MKEQTQTDNERLAAHENLRDMLQAEGYRVWTVDLSDVVLKTNKPGAKPGFLGIPGHTDVTDQQKMNLIRWLETMEGRLALEQLHQQGHWSGTTSNGQGKTGFLRISKFIQNGRPYAQLLFKEQRQTPEEERPGSSENLKFEALFQHATMSILVADETGRIAMANRYTHKVFGYEEGTLIGQRVEDLMPAKYRSGHTDKRAGFMRNPQSRPMGQGLDLFAQRKDGSEFPVEISLGNYATQEGQFVIAFIIDTSQRKENEQAVIRHQKDLERVNREIEELNDALEKKVDERTHRLQEIMQALEQSKDELEKALSKEKELSDLKSRFVTMASHEFRTPLSTILSSASLMAKYTKTEEQDKRDKHVQRIRSAVSNLTDILNDFLSIGRIEEGRVQLSISAFSLADQAQLVCDEMKPLLREGQQIHVTHRGEPMVHLDLSLLRNVFINLLSNAIKFSLPGGIIEVLTAVNDGQIRISIRDYGMGIAEDDQKHLFERFFRGRNVTHVQGTGLGLHIVSRYVDLMGGRIMVKSKLEKGTEFLISFDK